MKNIVLLTAKGGNTSIKNKNLIQIENKTFMGWELEAAFHANSIDEVFVTTEDENIKSEALKYGAKIIDRPIDLSQAFTNHGDVIIHGVKEARNLLNEEINIVTIIIGNTALTRAEDIDNCISVLENHTEADSVMTVWKAQDDHPFRAMKINEDGYLEGLLEINNVDTNRQSYPDIYYYDQGPWCVRYESLMRAERGKTGPACWWWMNNKCIPVIRNWVTGKDVHTQLDIEIARAWIKNELWKY